MAHVTLLHTATVAVLVAQENGGVLARSFLIAVVVMAPVALWQWWRVVSRRREAREPTAAPADVEAADSSGRGARAAEDGTLEAMVHRIGVLSGQLAPGEHAALELEQDLTLSGRPAPVPLVSRLLHDALARSGLEGDLVTTADGSRVLECRRPQRGARLDP